MARSRLPRDRSAGIRGSRNFRKLLANADKATEGEISEASTEIAKAVLADQLRLVPRDQGDLAAALTYRVSKSGLNARIGLVTKQARSDHFYARFVEFGTKGFAGRVRPGLANREPYTAVIPPQAPRPFIGPSFDMNRDEYVRAMDEAKRRAIQGLARKYLK
jgi:HK97 gp10 family phage protein